MKIILPNFIFRVERWKWNKEFRVYVSNMGNFKDEYKRNLPIKIDPKTGYCRVKTYNGIYKYAHRLVMLTWRPIPNAESLTVDHLNHNKRENTVYNLEWVTKKENISRAKQDLISHTDFENVKIKALSPIGGTCVYPTKEFNGITEAAEWVAKQNKCQDFNINKMKNRIVNAISNNQNYMKRQWKIER